MLNKVAGSPTLFGVRFLKSRSRRVQNGVVTKADFPFIERRGQIVIVVEH